MAAPRYRLGLFTGLVAGGGAPCHRICIIRHPGSAATLDQLLAKTSDKGKMGGTSALEPLQPADLLAYLPSL